MHIYPNHLSWNAQTVGKIDLHNRRETWAVKVLLKAPQILVIVEFDVSDFLVIKQFTSKI